MTIRILNGSELPPPIEGKLGWPWDYNDSAPILPGEEGSLPKISIITPSFNQGDFLEETIRSVLLQCYPNLEFIVIDGKSTDQTPSILEHYSDFIDTVVSEKDDGQSHAINKGLAIATGDLITWLNSDDLYCSGTLLAVGRAYRDNPEAVIAGNVINFDETREWVIGQPGLVNGVTLFWKDKSEFQQPGMFIPRSLWKSCGTLDQRLFFAMDFDLLCRIEQQKAKVVILDQALAKYRWHPSAKSSIAKDVCFYEQGLVSQRYINKDLLLTHHLFMSDNLLSRSIKHLLSANLRGAMEQMKILAQLKLLPFLPIAIARIPWRLVCRLLQTGRITHSAPTHTVTATRSPSNAH